MTKERSLDTKQSIWGMVRENIENTWFRFVCVLSWLCVWLTE